MRIIKSEKGMAIPLVLIVLVVLALLGTALWQYSMSEIKNVAGEEDSMQAFYVARSGAESVARHIRLNPNDAEEIFKGDDFAESNVFPMEHEYLGEIGNVKVLLERVDEDKLEVIGIGEVNGIEKSVTIVLELIEFPAPDAVVVTTSSNHVNFHQNMTVNGSIVAGGPVTLPNSFDNNQYTSTPNYPFPEDYFKRVEVPEDYDVHESSRTVGNNQTFTIEGGKHYQIDSLTNRGTINFDFSNGTDKAILVVTDLELRNNSEINILGTGIVEIYIRNTAIMHNPKILFPEGAQLQFFLAEGCDVSLNGNVQFEGLFYGPYNTHVRMQSNTSVLGAMIVGTLSGQGGNNHIGAAGTNISYYAGFGDLEFLPIVNQLHWKP